MTRNVRWHEDRQERATQRAERLTRGARKLYERQSELRKEAEELRRKSWKTKSERTRASLEKKMEALLQKAESLRQRLLAYTEKASAARKESDRYGKAKTRIGKYDPVHGWSDRDASRRKNPYRESRAEAESNARSHSRSTRSPWIVTYNPRTRNFHAYSLSSVRSAPFGETKHLVSVWKDGQLDDEPIAWSHGRSMRRASRDASRTARAWSLWSDGGDGEWMFVEAFSDKGQAEAKARRLKLSHPYARYQLRRGRMPAARLFDRRGHRRAKEKRFSRGGR